MKYNNKTTYVNIEIITSICINTIWEKYIKDGEKEYQ